MSTKNNFNFFQFNLTSILDALIVTKIAPSQISPKLNITRINQIIFVTIIVAAFGLSGCKLLKISDNNDPSSPPLDYLGQTPVTSPQNNFTYPAAPYANSTATSVNSTAANSAATNFYNNTTPKLPAADSNIFANTTTIDPFGATSTISPTQNQTPNPNYTANITPATSREFQPNYTQPHEKNINGENLQYLANPNLANPTTTPPTNMPPTNIASNNSNIHYGNSTLNPTSTSTPPISPFNNSQNISPATPAHDFDVWGDSAKNSQSITEAAKNENENLEKNRLLEIAKTKRLQDADPKKKYLQPFANRLGPFVERENREIIDNEISIISPVTYLQENPKIYDNKPIYDWEKEEHAAFDWSMLDPANFYKQILDKTGLGVNEEKAKKYMQEGRDILLKIKEKSDVTAAKQTLINQLDKTQPKSTKEQIEQERLYYAAGKNFAKAAKHLPDSLLQEDALFMAGESFFFSGYYKSALSIFSVSAFEAYHDLMSKYKHSKHLDIVAQRLFLMARYWEAADRKRKWRGINLNDKTIPVVDAFGYAQKAYEMIFINDPNNPLADDAVMAIASAHLARGRYEGDTSYEKAAFYFKYLTENYPLSEHFDEARKGELFARSEAYMGAEYNQKTLDSAKELAEIINSTQLPNAIDNDKDENNAIAELNENIITKNAEREWVLGQYYDVKKYYGSAKMFYQKVIDKYPQTTYAEKARKRLEQIKNKPDKPTTINLFKKNNTK
ncbi:MAG: hypothetical protein LBP59_16905 [Planctomycetaceae bacterium]|jgi:hypothetical protein|nr:hypothetical protein [Planctomycetaceae bacterium]